MTEAARVFDEAACCPESAPRAVASHSASMTFTAGGSVLALVAAAVLNLLAVTYKRSFGRFRADERGAAEL